MTEYVMVPRTLLIKIDDALYEKRQTPLLSAINDLFKSAQPVSAEPVEWQFYCEESQKWCGFINEEHKKNTIADGFKIRALYAAPQPEQQRIKCNYGIHHVSRFYQVMREHDSTIPDDALDSMRDTLRIALQAQPPEGE